MAVIYGLIIIKIKTIFVLKVIYELYLRVKLKIYFTMDIMETELNREISELSYFHTHRVVEFDLYIKGFLIRFDYFSIIYKHNQIPRDPQ